MSNKKMKIPRSLKILLWFILGFYAIAGLIMAVSAFKADEPFQGWLFYWDGPYKGKVIDADTERPIEGVAVVGKWTLETYGGPGGPVGVYCDAREALTDKNGEFAVPKAFCVNLWPFTKLGIADFILFKPGYDSYPPSLPIAKQNSSIADAVDTYLYSKQLHVDIVKSSNNIIRLTKTKNYEERKWIEWHVSLVDIPDQERLRKTSRMIKLINKERQLFGLGPIYLEDYYEK
jgi:hypothetical protein